MERKSYRQKRNDCILLGIICETGVFFQSDYEEEGGAAGEHFRDSFSDEVSFLIQVLWLILSALRTAAE